MVGIYDGQGNPLRRPIYDATATAPVAVVTAGTDSVVTTRTDAQGSVIAVMAGQSVQATNAYLPFGEVAGSV